MISRIALLSAAMAASLVAVPAQAQFVDRGEQTSRALLGSGLGALAGSAIAGNSSNAEGAIAGALLGGVLGAATSPRRFAAPNYAYPGYAQGYAYPPQGFVSARNFGAQQFGASYGYGYPALAAPQFQQPVLSAPRLPVPLPPASFMGYVPGQSYTQTYTSYVQPQTTVRALPAVQYAPARHHGYSYSYGSVGTYPPLQHGERIVGYSSGCYSGC